jgi:hypothetical protein
MSLPILSSPHFDVKLPSGKVIKMRSMVMSEYKILMIAKESPANMPTAIIQVLSNCVMDSINVTDLELCDIEYLFIQLHASSTAKQAFMLKVNCTKCETVNPVPINLENIKSSNTAFDDKIFSFSGVDIVIGSPTFKDFLEVTDSTGNEMDSTLAIIGVCIKSVTSDNQVMIAGVDFTKDEAKQMIESVSIEQLLEISNYVKEIPRIELYTGYECKKCGHKETVHIKGVSNFFESL